MSRQFGIGLGHGRNAAFTLSLVPAGLPQNAGKEPSRRGVRAVDRRIRMIVPVPVPQAALGAFAAQIPAELMMPGVSVEFTCAARGGSALDSHYDGVIADAWCLGAGARAEEEGCAAVCINSMKRTETSRSRR